MEENSSDDDDTKPCCLQCSGSLKENDEAEFCAFKDCNDGCHINCLGRTELYYGCVECGNFYCGDHFYPSEERDQNKDGSFYNDKCDHVCGECYLDQWMKQHKDITDLLKKDFDFNESHFKHLFSKWICTDWDKKINVCKKLHW